MENQGKRLTSQNLFRRTTQCKAKDPRVCPYHGAVIRMEEAQQDGDFDTYFTERLTVEEAERQGWVDEQIKTLPRDEDYTKDDIISAIDKHKPSQKMYVDTPRAAFFADLHNSQLKGTELKTKIGDIMVYDAVWGEENGGRHIWVVFMLGGRYWVVNGNYDSWSDNEWYVEDMSEVQPKKTLTTLPEIKYEPIDHVDDDYI